MHSFCRVRESTPYESHRTIGGVGAIAVKPVFGLALAIACCGAVTPRLRAQTAPAGASAPAEQNKPAAKTQSPASAPPQSNGNAFPEDESTVPVLPSKNTPDVPPGSFEGAANGRAVLPAGDVDPVQSPDDSPENAGAEQGSSSSLAGIDSLLPGPDDEEPGKRGGRRGDPTAEHHETAAEDESVGKYYLDNKNWRAALSRFQSAMVLDPDNPEVYWGLAESDYHLGKFADARANYQKVMEYDPDSKHAKEAKKTLSEPELANAKPSSAGNSAPKMPQ
jgi:tetratricopeptide (TPR) repeat protein